MLKGIVNKDWIQLIKQIVQFGLLLIRKSDKSVWEPEATVALRRTNFMLLSDEILEVIVTEAVLQRWLQSDRPKPNHAPNSYSRRWKDALRGRWRRGETVSAGRAKVGMWTKHFCLKPPSLVVLAASPSVFSEQQEKQNNNKCRSSKRASLERKPKQRRSFKLPCFPLTEPRRHSQCSLLHANYPSCQETDGAFKQ